MFSGPSVRLANPMFEARQACLWKYAFFFRLFCMLIDGNTCFPCKAYVRCQAGLSMEIAVFTCFEGFPAGNSCFSHVLAVFSCVLQASPRARLANLMFDVRQALSHDTINFNVFSRLIAGH